MRNSRVAFLMQYTPYQEEAGLLRFLTSEGIISIYDGYLTRRSYAHLRHQPEHLFEITYTPSLLNQESLFLKSWDIKQEYQLSSERLFLWHGLLAFARLIQGQEHAGLLFRFYRKALVLLASESVDKEKIYFIISYIFMQLLALTGTGDFSYHYEKIWKKLKLAPLFHENFLHHGQIAKEDFDVVLQHVLEHLEQLNARTEIIAYFRLCLRSYHH